MRPRLGSARGVLELNHRFGLHPALAPLLPLWRRGELAVAQAVATPYRDKRSHFDGQDLLETGGSDPGALHDGWLNRALALMPGAQAETALSVGREGMLLLRGQAPTLAWSPGDHLRLGNDERGLLYRLYRGRPAVSAAARERAEARQHWQVRRLRPQAMESIPSPGSPASASRPTHGSPPSRSAVGTPTSARRTRSFLR